LLARTSHKTFAKKQYPKQKKHRQIKTTTSKTPNVTHQSKPQLTKKKKGGNQQKTPPASSKFMNSKGTLAMLDDVLNQEKHAPENPQVKEKEDLGNDEPISLDTKEAKYVSYFSRIKQQIQRVWIYPTQGTKASLIGELTLKFEISKDGNLLAVRLINSSGSNILDANAIKAVRGAAPYYPFPITITKKKLSILATFVYSAK